jgi:hypothetical protein
MSSGLKFRRGIACLLMAGTLIPIAVSGASQTAKVGVQLVQPYMGSDATGVLVAFTPAVSGNPEGCAYTAGDQVWIDFSATVSPSGRDLYTGVLAGISGNNHMFIFYMSGCNAQTGRPLVYAVGIY